MYFVYVIQSETTEKIYIGYTSDLVRRLKRHHRKLPVKTKSYTYKNKGPWRLIYKEKYSTRKEALEREKELKSSRGREFIKKTIMGR